MRASGSLHKRGRVRRGLIEFLRVPLLIAVGFCIAAVVIGWADSARVLPPLLRGMLDHVVPSREAVSFISAVATSLMTVTSITFSVLLIAVQQTASSLTPVVFDQYLRRTSNRVYFGFFVGATAFAFILLATARQKPAPELGAVVTLVLTLVALVALLFLIHSTVDQMRPQSVVRSIHELGLRARQRELRLLGRCRVRSEVAEGAPVRAVRSPDSGYVVSIDLDRLARVAEEAGDEGEVVVTGHLGQYILFGEVIAEVTGLASDDDGADREVVGAFELGDVRDVDAEGGYAIDQLENIAWATGSSAIQSPSTSASAIRAIGDLVARWLESGERDRSPEATRETVLPVVYEDGATDRGISALAAITLAATESSQAQTAAELVRAFALIAPRLESDDDRAAFTGALDACLPALAQHGSLPALMAALRGLSAEMSRAGMDASHVDETSALLTRSASQLQPKPSSEPSATHPEGR
ncbi:DUF2254 family protein [uncultured Leifsonia sp.]|uniref:DUF2254 family protein n=1 Tax=uncultured Leifsonia sp. TaxID=340359 RepID=UPI0025E54E39|nr:DUF2254 family protein [uncultured Leifsonia sp.]